MRKIFPALFVIFIVLRISNLYSQSDTLLSIIKEELQYQFDELSDKDYPPYFMSFNVSDAYLVNMSYVNGALIESSIYREKLLSPEIRIGDYHFDNTHTNDKSLDMYDLGLSNCSLPEENDPLLIKYKIWEVSLPYYESVKQQYIEKLEQEKDIKNKNNYDDFSREPVVSYYEPPLPASVYNINLNQIKERLKKYTLMLQDNEEVVLSTGDFNYRVLRKYFVSTEGTSIVENSTLCVLSFNFFAKDSADGFVPLGRSYYAFEPEGLPDDSTIIHDLNETKDYLVKLINAKKADPYTGPAILGPDVTGVFFHEILGHRIEGHRLEQAYNSKTFKEKVGDKVINKDLSVFCDPTIKTYNGIDMIGYYKYDDQGVEGQKVLNIKDGVLNDFLMSRKPITGFNNSNGHGRSNIGVKPVSRQSNLFVTTDNPKTEKYLRKRLIKECKKQGVDYGYYIAKVLGGYTNTMNFSPDVFNITPVEVYRVYVDGRPDELVKGVNLIGTPLTMFSEIIAAGDTTGVFTGMCGAESGYVPVTAVAPAVLLKKIETQNQFVFKPEWPILPDPANIND